LTGRQLWVSTRCAYRGMEPAGAPARRVGQRRIRSLSRDAAGLARARHGAHWLRCTNFTNPLWLAERGGWTNEEVMGLFERLAAKVVEALGDLCQRGCTINEPNIYAAEAYVLGRWSPGESDLSKFIRVTRNQFKAHAAAYQAIRRRQSGGRIGLVQHMAAFEPANPASAADRSVAGTRSQLLNWRFVEAVIEGRLKFPYGSGLHPYAPAVNSSDYIGLNYYGRHPLRFDPGAGGSLFASPVPARPELAWPPPWTIVRFTRMACSVSSSSWPAMAAAYLRHENGLAAATADDEKRAGFILTHLAALQRAIRQGADVRGYYYWTLVDNYEWVEGWTTPFGLIELDPATQKRTPRCSAALFGELAHANAITEEMVEKYAPGAIDQVFAD